MARSPSPSKRSPLTPFYAILGLVALVGVGLLAYQLFARDDIATTPVAVTLDAAELQRVQGIAIGPENAPVVIYEFADFQCPGCGQFAAFVSPLIKDRLVQQGMVRFVYYDFPLPQHPHAFLAARAARCANEQGRFWEYHDLLYGRQPTWSAMTDASDYFIELGEEAGLNQSEFEACVRSDRFAEEVSRSLELGRSLGVQSTPTVIVNGKRLAGVPSFSELEAMVQQEAGMAGGAAPAAGGEGAQPEATTPQ